MKTISINDGVIYRIVNDKTYILNEKSKNVLHGVANEIWQLILEQYNYDEIVSKLLSEYDIDKDILTKDISQAINSLYRKQILVVDGEIFKKSESENSDIQEKDNMLSNFYDDINFLYKVVVEVTYNCNNKCEYCYNGEYIEEKFLNTSKMKNLIDECKKLGVMHLSFTGGEPFMRKDLLDIIKYAHENNFYITLQTNGTMITEQIAEELSHYAPLGVAITIHSADKNVHDSFTKVKGSYERAINGIKLLTKYNIPVTIRYVITQKNYDGLKAYSQLAKDLNVRYNVSPLLYPSVDGSLEPLKLRLRKEQISEFITEGYYFPQADPCGAAKTKLVISPEGKVYPCPFYHMEIGDVKIQSLKEIFNTNKCSEVSKLFERPETCNKCNLAKNCPRCPIIAYYQEGSFDGINKYDCMIANLYNDVGGSSENAE